MPETASWGLNSVLGLYGLGFFLSCLLSLCLVPIAIRLSHRYRALDLPGKRKIHSIPVPRWGGLAVFGGIFGALGALALFSGSFHGLLGQRYPWMFGNLMGMPSVRRQFAGIFFGSTVLLCTGLLDDQRGGLSAWTKLLLQVIAAYVAMDYGIRIAGMHLPWLGYLRFPIILSQVFTVLWVLTFVNAVNLVDGMDGLAAGLAAVAASSFIAIGLLYEVSWGRSYTAGFIQQMHFGVLVACVVLGSCSAFLYFNFHPARVFLGDGGAYLLGYLLGVIAIAGMLKSAAFFAAWVPFLVVAVPVADVGVAVGRRWLSGKKIFDPDQEHFHHRLLSLGWTQREIVFFLYCIGLGLSQVAIIWTAYRMR